MKKVTFGIAALSVTFAGAALAQAPATNPAVTPGSSKVSPAQFSTMDTNRDGKISRDEVKSHAELTSSFATLDTDRDTYLSESEFGKHKDSGKGMMPGHSPGSNSGMTPGTNSGNSPGTNSGNSQGTDSRSTPGTNSGTTPAQPGTR